MYGGVTMSNEGTENGLSSIYATSYQRDNYVQMNNDYIDIDKIKERHLGILVKNGVFFK